MAIQKQKISNKPLFSVFWSPSKRPADGKHFVL